LSRFIIILYRSTGYYRPSNVFWTYRSSTRTYAHVHMHTERSTNAYNKTPLMPRGVVGEKKPRTTRLECNKNVFKLYRGWIRTGEFMGGVGKKLLADGGREGKRRRDESQL